MAFNAQLRIKTRYKNARSEAAELYYSAPYKLTRHFPFLDSGIEYILMCASAGIMAGDMYQIDIQVAEQTSLALSSQSYEKIHNMAGGSARKVTHIAIENQAYLRYMPLPSIPFAGATLSSNTQINLAGNTAKLIYLEMLTSGRHHRNERFAFKQYATKLEISLAGKLVYLDNLDLQPLATNLAGYGFFEGFNYLASLIIYGFNLNAENMAQLSTLMDLPQLEYGISQLNGNGHLIRILSNNSELILTTIQQLTTFLEKTPYAECG